VSERAKGAGTRPEAKPERVAEQTARPEITQAGGVRQCEAGVLDGLQRNLNPGDFFLAASQRAEHQKIRFGLRQDNPLATARPH
jgi:hypothetical protein